MLKVKVVCGWEDTKSITKRVKEQFLTDKIKDRISFVYDDSYDVIVYNNYITEKVKEGAKSCIFFHEPTWSGNHQRVFNNHQDINIFGFDSKKYAIGENTFIESPAKMFYGGRGPWTEGHNFWTYSNIISKEFVKTKNISSVVSNLGFDGNYGPEGCLYKERYTLIKNLINKIHYIDYYGWGESVDRLKGNPKEKKDGLVEYKFSICIENSHENNYVSEKFFDCILTNTIPIYFGCKNIKEIIPEDCFIQIKDINDIDEVINQIETINNNCDEIYNNMLPKLLNLKKRYFNDFNILNDLLTIDKNKNIQ